MGPHHPQVGQALRVDDDGGDGDGDEDDEDEDDEDNDDDSEDNKNYSDLLQKIFLFYSSVPTCSSNITTSKNNFKVTDLWKLENWR